jgi:transcriptional regulator with XRE-family HTH domain
MKRKGNKFGAVSILHNRYIGDNAEKKASLQEERINCEVARMIYELRNEAGLKQEELAKRIGTTQSVISRLEDADYGGHSLSMLDKIAKALNQKIKVIATNNNKQEKDINFAFQTFIRGLRKEKGLEVNQFSEKSGIDKDNIIAMEKWPGYTPPPFVLHKLSKFYKIPQKSLAVLAGAMKNMPPKIEAEASRFAAQSESFSKLTKEERKTLDAFVKFLRSESSEE